MRAPVLITLLATASPALDEGLAAQGPGAWGKVKTWKGTVTVELNDSRKSELGSWTLTYSATGDFSITDEALGDGDHVQWPMLGPESYSNPAKMEAAMKGWHPHVVARFEFKGVNEQGQPISATCTADEEQASAVGVVIDPMEPRYGVDVTIPRPTFKCTGSAASMVGNPQLPQSPYHLTGKRGDPGPVSGSQEFTSGTTTAKVSYKMAPAR